MRLTKVGRRLSMPDLLPSPLASALLAGGRTCRPGHRVVAADYSSVVTALTSV
jgi:hypothetical protein